MKVSAEWLWGENYEEKFWCSTRLKVFWDLKVCNYRFAGSTTLSKKKQTSNTSKNKNLKICVITCGLLRYPTSHSFGTLLINDCVLIKWNILQSPQRVLETEHKN
jgi:hypothetical protein